MRLLLFKGKGGVGKTATAASTAALAARLVLRTLVLSADAAHSLGDAIGCALTPSPSQVALQLDAMGIDVSVKGLDLDLRVRDGRRSLCLPDSLVGRPVERVRLWAPTLEIFFGAA